MKLLENKNLFITGGSKGIGKAIIELFAEQGANIAFTSRKQNEEVENLLGHIKSQNVKGFCYYSDAVSFEQTEKAIHDAEKDLGHIDILINNAGIVRDNLLMRMKEGEWDEVLNNNLKSVFNTTKVALPMMLRQKSGSIINISSIVGMVGGVGQCNYAASKAGIIGFSKSVAKEIGSRNIRCNVIAPGFIKTSMTAGLSKEMTENWIQKTALRRAGRPQEIASAALFLASDLSSFITGQVLVCDGGMI